MIEILKEFAVPIMFCLVFIIIAIIERRDTQARRIERNRKERYREVNIK